MWTCLLWQTQPPRLSHVLVVHAAIVLSCTCELIHVVFSLSRTYTCTCSSFHANSLRRVYCQVICLEATKSTTRSNDLMTAWRFSHANSCQGNYVDTVSALAARCEHVETGCDSWSGLCRRVDNTMPLLMFVMYVHVHERIYTHKHFVHTARGQNIIFYYFCSIRQN